MHITQSRSQVIKKVAAAGLFSLVLTGCNYGTVTPQPTNTYNTTSTATSTATATTTATIYGESADGMTVSTLVGSSFTVELQSLPGAGYSWEFLSQPDATVLTYQGPTAVTVVSPTSVGGPETEHWIFSALKAGTTDIKLRYRRPFESPVPTDKTYTLHVVVK